MARASRPFFRVVSREGKHTVPFHPGHPRPTSDGPNNNDEIAIYSDNEETMLGKDTEYPVGRDKKRERDEESERKRGRDEKG